MAIDITGINHAQSPLHKRSEQTDTAPANGSGAAATDSVTLQLQAKGLHVDAAQDDAGLVDGSRVESLKSAIDAGVYQINPLRVAEKFIQFEADLEAP